MSYTFNTLDDCLKAKAHLTSCDADGYCNACGEQDSPTHTHDCARCKFLGSNHTIDIYWCINERNKRLTSIIGRYDSGSSEYASFQPPCVYIDNNAFLELIESFPWYRTALKLAEAQGLYDPVTMNAK